MVNHILTVRGRKASVTPRTLVQGTVGQDTLTLDLDSEWNGLNVTATFVAATTEVTPVLNANMCEIPHEVLVDSGEVDVFVLGTRDGKAMRHASLAHKMVVKKSNMSDGSTTADPSISAYRQAYDDAVKATESANSAAGAAGSTAAEMATLNKRYAAQIEQQTTAFSTDQIQRANDFSTAQTQRANDFSTAQNQRAHDFDSAMQGYENAFNEAEGERVANENERVKAEEERGKAEEKRSQDSKTRLEELAQAKTNTETATGEANTARDEAKKAATDATSAAGKATDAASLAETAKTNANTAAEEANAAATKAETAARKADGAAETAGTAASTAERAANKADTAAGNAESMAEKADASANKADIAAGKANEATVAATNAATKANEVEAKLTGNVLKGKANETFVHVDDAFPSSLLAIEVEGACRQDGTPSPDNPVPIEVIEHPVVKVIGRNLWPFASSYKSIEGHQNEFVNDKTPFAILPGEYMFSAAGSLGNTDAPLFGYTATGERVQFFRIMRNVTNPKYSFTVKEPIVSIYFISNAADSNTGTIYSIQLERNSTATEYKPYTAQTLTFTLPPEHPYLAKLPDGTADEIVVDADGNVELVARVSKAIIDASQLLDWGKGKALYEFPKDGRYYPQGGYNGKSVVCEKLEAKDGGDIYIGAEVGISVGSAAANTKNCTTVLRLGDGVDVSSIDGASFYYKLMTETRYPIGKIEMPKAQDSIVNAWTDAEVTPRTGIEYTRDVNIVVENLESAIASITQG